jgi:hypothetical protein
MIRSSILFSLLLFALPSDGVAQVQKSNGSIPTFVDIASDAGISMPTVFGGSSTNKYILETTGSGAAFLDYDNDGWLDIFLANGTTLEGKESPRPRNRLYRNNHDGTFADVTRQSGVARSGWSQGVCTGDIDNDGFEDLVVTYWGQNVLYRNNGGSGFADVTEKAGLLVKETRWGAGCSFFDYDKDGLLDLVIVNYIDFDLKTAPLPGTGTCNFYDLPVNCGPRGLTKARSYLYRNLGNGKFSDVSETTGFGKVPPSYGLGVLTADFDADGWPDIYVANDSDPSYLFWNNGDSTFTEDGMAAGVATSADGRNQSGMGVAAGDYDRDGLLDIFKTNFSDDLPNLYRNGGDRFFDEVTHEVGLGINSRFVGWGCGFFDADNDGWLDIVYVNGHVYPELDQLGGSTTYKQPKVFYQNRGDGTFRDVTLLAGKALTKPTAARAAAFGDFDNDGDVDILVNPINETPQLLRNQSTSGNHWIVVKLVGTRSNRSAIGAQILATTGKVSQARQVLSGGSHFSQHDLRVHFGLGQAETIDTLEIRWPSGVVQKLTDISVDQILTIQEKGSQ